MSYSGVSKDYFDLYQLLADGFIIHFVFQAYEGEIAYLKSQHQEVGNALLEREKEFQTVVLKNKELKKTISNMVSMENRPEKQLCFSHQIIDVEL